MEMPPQPMSGVEVGRRARRLVSARRERGLTGRPERPPVSEAYAGGAVSNVMWGTRERGLTRLEIESGALDGRVTDNGSVDATAPDRRRDILDFLLVEVRRDLDHDFRFQRFLDAEVVPLSDDLGQQPGEEILALESTEARGVGRGDVDDEDVGVGPEQTHAGEVVGVGIRRGSLVLAEVDSEETSGPQRSRQLRRRERVQRQRRGKEGRMRMRKGANPGL